jgi:glucose/arabinose dehydrogenase
MIRHHLLTISVALGGFISLQAPLQAQPTWNVGNTVLTEYNLVTGVPLPWELLWGPDDHIWATTRVGQVLRIDPQTGIYTTVLQKTVMNGGNGEPGMLGMALHPDWATTPKVYVVYCTGTGSTGQEKLSVFDWDGTSLGNEQVLLTLQAGGIHNGSRLLVLPDGTLLMTTGDVGASALAQDLESLQGKVLRLNLDGTVPADNPFPGSYVFTFGNRNSQGLALGPNGLIYSSEHGQNSDDELNLLSPGRNCGWPTVQGMCNTAAEQTFCAANEVLEPLKVWTPCIAVNGLEYYDHPAIPEWQNSLLMAVLGGLGGQYERLSVLELSSDGTAIEAESTYFSSFNQRVRDVCVNPVTGSVYLALNGTSYPGSGPNIIKEFRNEAYVESLGIARPAVGGLEVFPNPIEDVLQWTTDNAWQGAHYEVIGFNGKQLNSGSISATTMRISAADWSPGTYFLRISDSRGGAVTRTFQVQ